MRTVPRSSLLVLTLAFAARPAAAWPPYLNEWQSIYPTSTTDDEVAASQGQACGVCHFHPNGGTGWNPYGWDIRQRFLGGATLHDAIVEASLWDSERNPLSWSNVAEIAWGTQPGWTPGPNNVEYTDLGATTGQMPMTIAGSLDPASSPMAPMCDPGAGGVIACPCSNPSSGMNRGCENSSSTTGAALTAEGDASLSADTLVFTTAGERPTSFTILLQGTASIASGVVYGQGVRCVGGSLRRLFNVSAVGGSVTVPNFAMGDPSVSVRSAEKGDTIFAGTSRWYLAYYRDPNVVGGCAPANTFNATQTGQVDWGF